LGKPAQSCAEVVECIRAKLQKKQLKNFTKPFAFFAALLRWYHTKKKATPKVGLLMTCDKF
jgi:hypothetical protein